MAETKTEKSKSVYFGCRISSAVADKVRENARVTGRTIGHELERLIEYALPAVRALDTSMERERRESMERAKKKAQKARV